MKTLGLLGGMSWESTAVYYKVLNELTKSKVGETHSCPLILRSVDFDPIRRLSFDEDWEAIGGILCEYALDLERIGAEAIVICANTMHRVADQERFKARLSIPVINLIDAVSHRARKLQMRMIGVLGTKYTMQGEFYVGRLNRSGHEVLLPNLPDQEFVNKAIYDELVLGVFNTSTRSRLAKICEDLKLRGAEGIVLGCTELPMILSAEDCSVPFLDTTRIHCQAAIEFALSSSYA